MKRAAIAALLALSLGGAAAPAPVLTCASPVRKGDSAATLKARFGKAARVMKIHAAEGEMVDGLALWSNDPKRRIDVFFDDGPMKRIATLRITGAKSAWRIGGLGIGATLPQVVAANGRAVTVGGFGWDYGGGVDPRGGKLAKWPGGCRIGLTMDVGPDVTNPPEGISGDGILLNSGDPRLKAARPRVTHIYVNWRD
ncbi:MAG: hypothetical protein ACKOPM_11340 [Novosphingobium sp.]